MTTADYSKMTFAELRNQKFRKMPREELEKRIAAFLQSGNICVLATCGENAPRATPIEYYSKGTTVYVLADPGTKILNLKANPQISVGIYNTPYTDWTDWPNVKGAVITGKPSLITDDSPRYLDAMKVYKWALYSKIAGRDMTMPPMGRTVVKVEAQKIEYRDLGLLREGYLRFQVWEA